MNWTITYYDYKNNEICSFVINNKTEEQALKIVSIETPYDCKDFTLIPTLL